MRDPSHDRELGRLIARRREGLGLTQRDVAETLGYRGPQFISNIERGLAGLPLMKYRQLAPVLRMSLDAILEETLDPGQLADARAHFGLDRPAADQGEAFRLPLLAEVECDTFLWAESLEDNPEYIGVPPGLYQPGRFLLRARGDSMRNEIKHGDLCVFDPHLAPRTGCIVCAQLTGQEEGSTIKWYIDHGPYVELRPENINKLYSPLVLIRKGSEFLYRGTIPVQLLIKGVLAGLVREY